MSFQQTVVAFGILSGSALLGSPRPALQAQTPAAPEVTRSDVRLADARRAVREDRTRIDRLEELIDHERAAVIAEGWTPPSLDQWDRLVTHGRAKQALASLEVKLAGAERKLARDQGLVDSLEGSVLSAR